MSSQLQRRASLDRVSRASGLAAALIGATALLGWASDIGVLKSCVPGLVEMKANTAAGFVLTGLALASIRVGAARRAGEGLAMAATAIGLASLFEYVSGIGLGIDELVFVDRKSLALGLPPGRMAVATTLGFAMIGAALVLASRRRLLLTAQYLTFAAVSLPVLSFLAYLFGERAITLGTPLTSLAINTVASFFLIGVGVLCECSDVGPMAVFVAEDRGGSTLRRLLPLSLAVTLSLGLVGALGVRSGVFGFAGGMVIFAAAASIALVVAVWFNARSLSRSEAGRRLEFERFRSTLSSIGDAVIATESDGRVQFMNRPAEILTGWTADEAGGLPLRSIFRIINEATRAETENPVDRIMETGLVVGLANHTILIARDGTERPIDDSAAPILDHLGRTSGVVLVFRDITEKHEADRKLRESREYLQSVFDSAAEGVYVMDLAGLCSYINAAGAEMLGYAAGELIGRGMHGAIHARRPDGSAYPIEDCPIARSASAGVEARVDGEVFWRKDGSPIPVVYSANPMRLGGRAAGAVVTISDTTDRDRAARALKASEEQLRFALGAGRMGTWKLDLDSNRLDCTGPCKANYGREPDQVFTYDDLAACILEEDRGPWGATVEGAIARAEGFDSEYRVRWPDGTTHWVFVRASCVVDPAGRPIALSGVSLNLDDRKWIEERLRLLDALAEATRSSADPGEIMATAAGLLGKHLGVTHATYAEVEPDSGRVSIRREWSGSGDPGRVGEHSLDRFGPRSSAAIRAGRSLVVRDLAAEIAAGEGAEMFAEIGARAVLCCPLVKGGQTAALLAVYHPRPRDRADAEVALIEEVAARSWALIERIRDAASLREKDERFQLLVENVKDYAVVISDPSGTVTEWRGGAERITGHAAGDVIGQNSDLIFTPEDREAGLPGAERARAAATGRAEDKRFHLRKDGARFFADGVMTALYDPRGDLRGFGKVFKDVTGERSEQEARERRARLLQQLAEVATRINVANDVRSVVGVVTEEARHLIGARQAATGLLLETHQPRAIHLVSTASGGLHEPVLPDRAMPDFSGAIRADHGPIRLARGLWSANAAWRSLGELALVPPAEGGWLAAPLIGRDGRAIGLIQLADKDEGEFSGDDEAILVQLSRLAAIAIENARLYEELLGNDRRKDEFLAMLAHELRNPLAAIGAAVKSSAIAPTGEDSGWASEIITRQLKHLTRLIDDLLDVARISRGKIELRREILELAPILDGAAATVRGLVEDRKHAFEASIDRGNLWVFGDPTRLEQEVVNLPNNAAKYSENGGRIRLSARLDGEEVAIEVEDQGLGIPPDKLPQMFELFAQGDRTLARSEGGLGIGLTLVKRLVELHSGKVSAASEGIGQGSRFAIRLPVAARPSGAAGATETPAASPTRPARILVVDDNVDTVRGMARLLKLSGHEVLMAHNGPDAVEAAREHRPNYVLLDIGLPGMSGYEVASGLRREESCRGAVIIAVSGYGQEDDRRRSREAGFDHHFIKPVDHDVLLDLLAGGSNGRA